MMMNRMKDTIAIADKRATADYWTGRDPRGEELWLTGPEIGAVNERIRENNGTLTDLKEFATELPADELREMILDAQQAFRGAARPGEHYAADGSPIGWADYQAAQANCALTAIGRSGSVRYAVTAMRANLRLLPTRQFYFDDPDFLHYDDLQGTALDPMEPVLVLHESRDGEFFFVRARHYTGWVARHALAFTERSVWERYVRPKDFFVVTNNKKTFRLKGVGEFLFQMGSVLPIFGRKRNGACSVRFPVNQKGRLREAEAELSEDSSLHRGWLPCTRNNMIRQAFKFLGDSYGWGGMEDSVDCSSFVGDVYRSVGVELPRDANEQERSMPHLTELSGFSTEERYEALRRAPAGALLFKRGHVLMYLGTDEADTPLAIHAVSSYFTFPGGVRKKHYIRRVLVSDLRYTGWDGTEMIDSLTRIGWL